MKGSQVYLSIFRCVHPVLQWYCTPINALALPDLVKLCSFSPVIPPLEQFDFNTV